MIIAVQTVLLIFHAPCTHSVSSGNRLTFFYCGKEPDYLVRFYFLGKVENLWQLEADKLSVAGKRVWF